MHKFSKLIILFVLSIPVSSHAQQSSDTAVSIYFGSGKFTVESDEERKVLDAMRDSTNLVQIKEISAYTDSVGTVQQNLKLAQRRSKYVIDLLNGFSLVKGNYIVNNYGEQRPVSRTNLSLNRRVDIFYALSKKSPVLPDTGKVKLVRKLVLENLYFKPNQAVIEPASMPYMDYVANILLADSADVFEIKGHVNWNPLLPNGKDSGYLAKMNQLSVDRAKLVYEILIDKGIPPGRMSWKGMGNLEMIFPNASNDEEKRKNMRVEILILGK